MASEITLYTDDRNWKADVEAWKNNFLFYRSIGCQVTVYRREETKNVWGNTSTDWVKRNADSIYIQNRYSGSGPGAAIRERTWTNTNHEELKHWAAGVTLTIPVDDPTDVGGGAILDIDRVDSVVRVRIGRETLSGEVSADSAFSDSSIW